MPLAPADWATVRATLPHGGVDDSNRHLAFPPALRANLGPLVGSLRWGAIGFGLVYAVPEAIRGNLSIVLALSICMFLTTWRTTIPLRLGDPSPRSVLPAVSDVAVLGFAAGISGGTTSNFVLCLIAGVIIAGLGWGWLIAVVDVGVGVATIGLGMAITGLSPTPVSPEKVIPIAVMVAVVAVVVIARDRLLEAESRRVRLSRRVGALTETNELLNALNGIARTLPGSLNRRDAVESIRNQIQQIARPDVVALLDRTAGGAWTPSLAEGATFAPVDHTDGLSPWLVRAIESPTPLVGSELNGGGIAPSSRSGVYVRLTARGEVIAVLGIETRRPDAYGPREVQLIHGLAEVAGLTLDNARHFGHLRTLGAQNERTRIARDLHDRLGQWLTFFKMELERISARDAADPELSRLSGDAGKALDELRETLRQLRANVDAQHSFDAECRELITRFRARSDIEVGFEVAHPERHLAAPVETEVLRILQEALNNIEKHSGARHVEVSWDVGEHDAALRVVDDGHGFDVRKGVRDNSYGLVGMRERADVIGAELDIASQPGEGATVVVTIPQAQPTT